MAPPGNIRGNSLHDDRRVLRGMEKQSQLQGGRLGSDLQARTGDFIDLTIHLAGLPSMFDEGLQAGEIQYVLNPLTRLQPK